MSTNTITKTITKRTEAFRGIFDIGFSFSQTELSIKSKSADEVTHWQRWNDDRKDVLPREKISTFDDGKLSLSLSHSGSAVLAWAYTYIDTLLYIQRCGVQFLYVSALPKERIVFAVGRGLTTNTDRAFVLNTTNGKCLEFDDFSIGWRDCFVSIGFKNKQSVFIRKNFSQSEWDIAALY